MIFMNKIQTYPALNTACLCSSCRKVWILFPFGFRNKSKLLDLLRHTYATMLYHAGVDIKTAQYLLGHASIQMTMEIYTHLDTEKTKTAAKKLNDFISVSH